MDLGLGLDICGRSKPEAGAGLNLLLRHPESLLLPQSLKREWYITFFITLFLFFTPPSSYATTYPTPKAAHYTLPNGMEIVAITNTKTPAVSHMVWYKTGTMHQEPGKSGLAHFLEHMMFKGTDTYGPGQFSSLIAKDGGNDNAFTSRDVTAYYQNIAKEKLPFVMELEADRMQHLHFSAGALEKERQVVLEERRQRVENEPRSRLTEQMAAMLYVNHPYRFPTIGWAEEIKTLTYDDVMAFYHRYYAPNNAVLVVAGDITLKELLPLAEKYYGAIPARPVTFPLIGNEPAPSGNKWVEIKDKRVAAPEWLRYYLAPAHGYQGKENKDAYALTVLSGLLGENATSLLYERLVVEKKLALQVGSFYEPVSRGPSLFGLYAIPAKDVSFTTLTHEIDLLLADIMHNGVAKDTLQRTRSLLLAETIYAQEDLSILAQTYGETLATGLDTAFVATWPKRISAVSNTSLQHAAKEIFSRPYVEGRLLKEVPPAYTKETEK